jgi:hypothetical protein
MSAPFSASVLFRVCLPMVAWADRVPAAAESAAPRSVSRTADDVPDNINRLIQGAYTNAWVLGIRLGSTSFTDAAIAWHGGYEWDLHGADGSTPELSPYCPGAFSAGMDIGGDSGSGFLSSEQRATHIARFGRGKLSHGEKGSRMEIMDRDAPAGRWLRISRTDIADLEAIGWNRLAMSPGTEHLALCFIGLLGIAPSVLRRRCPIGGSHSRRHRRIHTGSYRIN